MMQERLSIAKLHEAANFAIPYEHNYVEEITQALKSRGRTPQSAAVLILVGEDEYQDPHLLYIKRSQALEDHPGQMAFPGGIKEKEENFTTAALRETYEEVGISPNQVITVGALPPLLTVTGYAITPILGILKGQIAAHPLRLNPSEIEEAVWISIKELCARDVYRVETILYANQQVPIHVFNIRSYRIWGATATMTANLITRLQRTSFLS